VTLSAIGVVFIFWWKAGGSLSRLSDTPLAALSNPATTAGNGEKPGLATSAIELARSKAASSREPGKGTKPSDATAKLTAPDFVLTATDQVRKIETKDLTAEDIVRLMRKKYGGLVTYIDTGRRTATWQERKLVYQDAAFRSFFKRPLFYRFEWLNEEPPFNDSYWANPNGVFDRRKVGVDRRFRDLGSLFGAAWGEAPYALQLLREETLPGAQDFFVAMERLPDEEANGVACFHLRGVTPQNRWPRELWIGVNDFLLRRVSTEQNTNYRVSSSPQYRSGGETITWNYAVVETELELPDGLFFPPAR
jgi:hypothetical protein